LAQSDDERPKTYKARKAQAKKHYAEGRRLYEDNEFDEALAEFQRAQDLDPQPAYVFNIAQSHRLRDDCENAEQYYRSFLRSAPDAPNRDDVEGWLAEMTECRKERQRSQDDRAETKATDDPEPESEPEYEPEENDEEEEGGEDPEDESAERSSEGRSTLGLWIAGGGVAVLGGAAYFGLKARQASADIDAFLSEGGVFDERLQKIQSRGQRDEKVSLALVGVGGSLVAGGLIYYFVSGREERAPDATMQVRFGASGDGASAHARWRF